MLRPGELAVTAAGRPGPVDRLSSVRDNPVRSGRRPVNDLYNHYNKGTFMKKIGMGTLLTALLVTSAVWTQAAKSDDAAEKAVAALENQWLQSQKTNNPNLVAPLLADTFVSIGADGKLLTKEQALTAQKQRKYSSVDYEDVHVTVYGSTAIATGVYRGKGTAEGKAFDEVERWTDTWVKMPNGKWQCVADHNTAISK
jgi:ketosteroid isomerase-like protein